MSNVIVKSDRYTVDPLYQWDLNQDLVIYGLSLASIPEIHFTNSSMDRAIVRQAQMDDAGVITVGVPNSLLQKPYIIKAYVCIYEGETFKSLYCIDIPVKGRTKPSDYILEYDPEVYSFNALENLVNNTCNILTLKCDNTIETVNEGYNKAITDLNEKCDDTIETVNEIADNAKNSLNDKCVETINTVNQTSADAIETITNKSNETLESISNTNERVSALETPTFTQATSRTNIASGNTMPTILGKIMKYFADLKSHAFNSLANNLTTTTAGYALDATQGKALNTRVTALETPTFTQATSRTNIASGNTMPTILGKIMKYFADLKSHAFNSLANNLTTTTTGYALDATQGKALNDKIGKVLWTNTNPVAFDTMTITLSSSDYDVLDIYYLWNTTSNFTSNISILKGYSSIIRQVGFERYQNDIVLSAISRTVNRSSDTVFTIDNFVSTDAVNYTNNYFIPIKVIGRKLS